MKPNTWNEIQEMITDGFSVVQPFWRNHAFVGALGCQVKRSKYVRPKSIK